MSMNVGNPGSGSDDPEVLMDINTTPLIDVMLVLLVMLIITIPIQLHAVSLDMPVGTPPTNNIKPEKIQIDIDENSVVYWQGLPVSGCRTGNQYGNRCATERAARGAYPTQQGIVLRSVRQCLVQLPSARA